MISKFFQNLFLVPPEADAAPYVVKHFKRNFTVNFFDIGTYFFGDSFLASYTILPVFVSTLTDSPIIIGLVPAFYEAGWFIPQLFFAPYIRRKARLMPLVIKLGAMERFSYLFLAAGAYFIPRMSRETALIVIMVLIIWRSLSAGFYALPWQEVIAKVIPVSHRGRFYGWANMFGKLLGILGAAITGLILARLPYPKNYSLVFFIGFIVVILALVFFLLTKEPFNHLDDQAKAEKVNWLAEIKRILSGDASFRNFMISRMLSFLGFMAFSFMAVYGVERFNLPDSYSAVFTGVLLVFSLLGYGTLGLVGDRVGNKMVLILSDVFLILSIVTALLWPTMAGLYFMFAMVGLSTAGAMIGDMNFVMEFGKVEDRPIYIGLSKTLTGPVFLLAPIIGGGIVGKVGYPAMFLTALVFSILAFVFIFFFVVEPRNQKNASSST
jgi:MFS family permease